MCPTLLLNCVIIWVHVHRHKSHKWNKEKEWCSWLLSLKKLDCSQSHADNSQRLEFNYQEFMYGYNFSLSKKNIVQQKKTHFTTTSWTAHSTSIMHQLSQFQRIHRVHAHCRCAWQRCRRWLHSLLHPSIQYHLRCWYWMRFDQRGPKGEIIVPYTTSASISDMHTCSL